MNFSPILFAHIVSGSMSIIYKGFIKGARRIARHLWRMSLALLIATASLFLGQPQVFPEVLRESVLLSAPVLLIIIMHFFWLIRE